MTVLLAVISSAVFGTGVALQQRQASRIDDRYAARLGLMTRLVRRPLWVLGIVAEIAGFALQVAALQTGSLVVVQPVIATSLLFTLGLSTAWTERQMVARDWLAVVGVVAGLAAFLVLASPSPRSAGRASSLAWVCTIGGLIAGLAACLLCGLRRRDTSRAALLGLAAGLGDSLMAVLTKAFAESLHHGVAGLLVTWTPYALCAAGLVALLISQTAYQAGRPTVSLPLIAVTDPVVTSAVGVGLFGESLHLTGFRAPGALLAVAALIAGLVSLTRTASGSPATSVTSTGT